MKTYIDMGLIDEGKIADGCNAAYLKLKHNAYFGSGFKSGVEFAETELQNLAIEFAGWIRAHHYRFNNDMNYWFTDRSKYTLNNEELFQKFIEQRKNETKTLHVLPY